MKTNKLVNAIVNGDLVEAKSTFHEIIAEKSVDAIAKRKKELAENLYKGTEHLRSEFDANRSMAIGAGKDYGTPKGTHRLVDKEGKTVSYHDSEDEATQAKYNIAQNIGYKVERV